MNEKLTGKYKPWLIVPLIFIPIMALTACSDGSDGEDGEDGNSGDVNISILDAGSLKHQSKPFRLMTILLFHSIFI